jgi:putative SOS response-associated peptidase YedK
VYKRQPLILSPNDEANWLNGQLALHDVSNRANIELAAWEVDKKLILGPTANSPQVSQRYCNNLAVQKGLFD